MRRLTQFEDVLVGEEFTDEADRLRVLSDARGAKVQQEHGTRHSQLDQSHPLLARGAEACPPLHVNTHHNARLGSGDRGREEEGNLQREKEKVSHTHTLSHKHT